MRKAINEEGIPFLTDEYKFVVYFDEGRWWVESFRNGDVIADIASGGDYEDIGFDIGQILRKNDRFAND
jgi:hypothetical protein